MPTLERPTVSLHYEEAGAGDPALVFLHGWCDGSPSWTATLAAFSREHRCLAPDMRGHNQSGLPRDHTYTPEALTNDVVALCEQAGVRQPVIVGHSYGGYLAAELARRFPGFVRAIVVEDQPLDLRAFAAQMRALEPVIRGAESHMAFRTQLYDSMTSPAMPPEARAAIARLKDTTPVAVALALWAPLFEFSEAEIGERSDALMAALARQPSLVINAAALAEYEAALARLAPPAQVAVIEGGHWIHLEHPAEFDAALRAFLAGL